MSDEIKKVRKVARCVQTMLDLDGVEITAKSVEELIKAEPLEDVLRLKDLVVKHLQQTDAPVNTEKSTDRREVLKDYISKNWDSIKDNEVVKTTLLNAYCMGRYKKDKREEMVTELVALCEGGTVVATVPTPPVDDKVDDKADDKADHRQYKF